MPTSHPTNSILPCLPISVEQQRKLNSIIQQNNWEQENGLRRILGAGAEFFAQSEKASENTGTLEKDDLIQRVIAAESVIASLQYRLYEKECANKNWELSSGAIQTENIGLRKTAFKQLERIDTLTLRNKQLEKEVKDLSAQLDAMQCRSESDQKLGLLSFFKNYLSRKKR